MTHETTDGLPPHEKLIMGIDPGTNVMGYAIIEVRGQRVKVLEYDVLNLGKNKKLTNHAQKLRFIFEEVTALLEKFLPDELAIEAPFYGVNVQSMLKLGRAQGVAIAAALARQIPYVEYAPSRVKQSVTGNGQASKEQVAAMVVQILKIEADPTKLLDATDALAVALCHHFQDSPSMRLTTPKAGGKPGGTKKKSGSGASGWDSFVTNNPGRVK
jgi:crossover junction endodeoxyribonuclease RuvC